MLLNKVGKKKLNSVSLLPTNIVFVLQCPGRNSDLITSVCSYGSGISLLTGSYSIGPQTEKIMAADY